MAKRIISGIFVLTALGALGVILAGALTSGEQLIVRFLTAVTVAALGLYVISDLRMQNEDIELPGDERPAPAQTRPEPVGNSAAAYMVTVTGQHHAVDPYSGQPQDLANSRLIRPTTGGPSRAVPPHPRTALSRSIPPSEAPTDPFASALADTAPLPRLDQGVEHQIVEDRTIEPEHGHDSDHGVENQVVEVGSDHMTGSQGGVQDEALRGTGFIASASFTYSGPLQSAQVEWPPKPEGPTSGVEDRSIFSDQAFGIDTHDGIDTVDIPIPDIPELEMDSPDDEYGPVTVDELLGELKTDLSSPPPVLPVDVSGAHLSQEPSAADDEHAPPLRPHLTLISSDSAARQIEAAHYAAPPRAEVVDVSVDEGDAQPPAPSSPVGADGTLQEDRLNAVIRSGEIQVIKTLIRQGMLSTEGPVTDRDVRTMVYVAFTSNELRKLIRSGGTPDRVRSGDVDLGPVELFDERRYAPLPKRIYDPSSAPPMPEAASVDHGTKTVIDLSVGEGGVAVAGTEGQTNRAEAEANGPTPPLPTPKHLYRKTGIDILSES
ncbi:MAG: hypothetical protein OER95_18005 [Acidimicrobiia bacterium]|nr:hypothetical protein [Acidimicrobiia bacterium]